MNGEEWEWRKCCSRLSVDGKDGLHLGLSYEQRVTLALCSHMYKYDPLSKSILSVFTCLSSFAFRQHRTNTSNRPSTGLAAG